MNNVGEGIKHEYELRDEVVFDKTTGLTWQQFGSDEELTYAEAEDYVCSLNDQKFAGYTDWRLPTLEEAISLMEPSTRKNGNLLIDPVLDRERDWIWTADKDGAWFANFLIGDCDSDFSHGNRFVRAVR